MTSTQKVFLNREACEHLGQIKSNFPGEVLCIGESEGFCDCPVRSKPPPLPTKLPFPEHDTKRSKEWILRYHASSTVNMCTHQALPLITGEPLRIFTDDSIQLHAIHSPSPIPVHFRDEVKAQLDIDVWLGVLERVPQNTPTTWLSRMVNATKAKTHGWFSKA